MISGSRIINKASRNMLPALMSFAGVVILIADAWIRNIRCMTVGFLLMIMAIVIGLIYKNKMNKKKLAKLVIVYGVIFWMVMFVAASVLIAFKLYEYAAAKLVILLLSGTLGYFFIKKTAPTKMIMAVFFGAGFVAIGLILDGLITYRFDPAIFNSPYLWASYVFVLFGAVAGGCVCGRKKK